MSWIKDNKFLVALGGGTLVGVILIFLAGYQGFASYQQAKEKFDASVAEALSFESLALYPRTENRDGKIIALAEYRQATESLQKTFDPFRPKELKNVTPQDFTNQLKAVNEEIRKACTDSATLMPDLFFCGFENYKTSLARGNATGILGYELAGIKSLMLALSKSGASELRNLYRLSLPEEDGREYKPQALEVSRPLSLEITFAGPEKSVREFLSAILKLENQYVVIRSLSVANSKKEPPRAADAKFDKPVSKTPAAAATDVFGGGFVLPGEEPKADDKKPAPATAPAPAAVDTSRILSQVLGNEEVLVFLRLDLMQFLAAKKLPQP
jgi:hypothetical protein